MEEYSNIALMKKNLNLERFDPPEKIEWLEKSYDGGTDFWLSLCKYHDSLFGNAGKSRPLKQYDFFHDLITRNRNRETPAFIWYDPMKHWQEVSYLELGQKAEQLSEQWRNLGVLPGETLCIVKQFGLGYLESLLAGLRIGVILSFIKPVGRAVIKQQLESLQPDYISTEDIYQPLLSDWLEKILIEGNISENVDGVGSSHTYMTGEEIALCFDPMCEDMFTPKPVFADFFYLSGIRDGLIGLELNPGDIFAAPGFNPILTQPSLVLSGLLNGATYLHLSMNDIKKDPDLLTNYPLKVLGITSKLRDTLMAQPGQKVKPWDSWFRDPLDISGMDIWELFIKQLELIDIPAGCMMWNVAMGGCLLFSRKRKGQALQNVLPMPGRKWQLAMMADDTNQALGSLGFFSVNASLGNGEESYLPTPCIISKIFLEYVLVGLDVSSRNSVCYPKDLVVKIVRAMDVCPDSVLVEIPDMKTGTAPQFHLLVFAGTGQTIDSAAIINDIKYTIKSEIGKEFFVDDIRIFPLFPRRTQENDIDEDWCSFQYLNGGLNQKSRNDLFLSLSILRAKCC
ncbi:MAG: hypothetical protein GY710_04875 [Desulfobacteraceae bacterium]|nr:hypothetical protein [Desulfobacteraceae bacterium]